MPTKIMTRLLAGTALSALLASAALGAEARPYDIAAQDAATALQTYAIQSGRQVLFPYEAAKGKKAPEIRGDYSDEEVLALLAASAGLHVTADDGKTVTLRPQLAQGAEGGSASTVDALIVTAQKREEDIQDVPIAISAFTQKDLEEQKIEGGFDLLKAIPNVTFSKSNFSSYNFSIRGIGTKAVSATTDPAVAVAFNSSTIIQNRLFEQEYFDVERVEVLRGPQGTLYGRNATAGVINVISAKPDLNSFDGWIKGEVGNYETKRLSAMVNVPLADDKLAVRVAGALTSRDGYDFNSITKNAVNGRELWSARVTIGFEPTERLRGNLLWERFEEDDNRSRTGKQLCHRDDGPITVGNTTVIDDPNEPNSTLARPALFSTGCQAGSLYDAAAFGTPNGLAFPFILSFLVNARGYPWGYIPDPSNPGGLMGANLLQIRDPYEGLTQTRDLRSIASFRDPIYRAKADILQLNFEFDLTDSLTLTSQTAYVDDKVYSFQDFNRFNTAPFFRDTSSFVEHPFYGESPFKDAAPGGVFCDPQLGCSNTMAGFDISRSEATQFTQELRLHSTFDGPINFSVGANYTDFEGIAQYYVMNNVLTALAMSIPFNGAGSWDMCGALGFSLPAADPVSMEDPGHFCPYIDPNPVESINGDGHNYFRSVNPFHVKSAAAFGELYWNINDELKLTAGLRYTDDRKIFTPVPTQLLLAPTIIGGGVTARGYPADPDMKMRWQEFTGRLGLDWQPELNWTDDTLLYGLYSRGYKGGGANPPTPGFATTQELLDEGLIDPIYLIIFPNAWPILELNGLEYGASFDPEFVNAFEIGTKNTMMSGRFMLNAHAFYYDYKDYQVSQIRNRTSVNENFDATVWGLEFETLFAPSRDLRINANLGYLNTKIGDGERSVDIMNRNLEDPNYTVFKSWAQIPANCVVPTPVAESWLQSNGGIGNYFTLCGGVGGILNLFGVSPIDPATEEPFTFDTYPELNGGSGFETDLSGNELPNAPHWTANIGIQYGKDILGGEWRATVRTDAYWQSQSYHRVYNYEPYDKLQGWYNLNLSVWIERPDDGLKIELYAKNLLDDTPLTDAFLNSDDSGLTTNVFTLDPRLIGLSIRKEF